MGKRARVVGFFFLLIVFFLVMWIGKELMPLSGQHRGAEWIHGILFPDAGATDAGP